MKEHHHLSFSAIGTSWDISLQCNTAQLEGATSQIHNRIDTFDKAYSRFRADSLVTKMSEKAGTYTMPPDAQPMMELYRQLYTATQGKLTPLIGRTISDAGYDASYSLKPSVPSATPKWEDVMTSEGNNITLKQPTLLDLGALGKGYLIDLVAEVILHAGISGYTINAGGDILHHQTDKLRVGLENPFNHDEVVGIARINDGAICGSAPQRRSWGEYHHIFDPDAARSKSGTAAVWITADTAMLADGLATAMFFITAAQLKKHYNFEYALVRDTGELEHSTYFPAEFYTSEIT